MCLAHRMCKCNETSSQHEINNVDNDTQRAGESRESTIGKSISIKMVEMSEWSIRFVLSN